MSNRFRNSLAVVATVLTLWSMRATAQESNPAAIPAPDTPRIWGDRWREKLARVQKEKFDLLFIGDSITEAWDYPQNQPVWSAYYGGRNAIDLGYSGARTENILWMLENGEVDNQSPKVAVVLIGTNNTDGKHFPTAHTPEQIAGGIVKIVSTLRTKLPKTKILLLNIFPRDDIPGTRQIGRRAGEIASRIADGMDVTYLDIGKTFLKQDGTVDPALMPDLLHPNSVGDLRWAQAMEPALRKLMGMPVNSASVPASGVEQDFYNWQERHAAVMAQIKKQPVDLVFIGDSITHMFGGEPASNISRGVPVWDEYYGKRNALNLGFGWDRTQQALWRLRNGEFQGLHPKAAVILIGTNNLVNHAVRANTNDEIVAGIKAVCTEVRKRSPKTQILLMGLLPRDKEPGGHYRTRILEVNRELARLSGQGNITFIDIGDRFLQSDGTMLPDVTVDFLHPSEKGYRIWAEAIEPTLARMLDEHSP